MTDTPPLISVSKEIIWHMSCGQCGYYWTVPTMREEDNPTRRVGPALSAPPKARLNAQTN